VENDRVLNLDPKDPLWVGDKKPDGDHPTGQSHRATLKMDWSHGHNATIHNGISRIGFYTGGKTARFRDEDLGDKWIEKANTWIEAHRAQPFFLFFASHDLHVPRMPHERFQGTTKLGFRGDSIAEFDWSVGELMKTLDRLGLAEKTLIVLCSDNGPVMDDGYKDGALEQRGDHRAGGPYRGGKYSVYEGGTRTPFITRWKGRIQPGVSAEVVSTIDLAASLAALAPPSRPTPAVIASTSPAPSSVNRARRAASTTSSRTTAARATLASASAIGNWSVTKPNLRTTKSSNSRCNAHRLRSSSSSTSRKIPASKPTCLQKTLRSAKN
jgi:arylsulfatase A